MDSLESNVFINEDDFLKKINCFNLNLIEVDSYNDLDIILSLSVDSFLTFAHKKQLDIFYQFNYLDETDYLITGSTVIDSIPSVLFSSHQIHSDFPAYLNSLLSPDNSLSVPDDFQKSFNSFEHSLASKIINYDHSLDEIYFSHPESVVLFVLFEGHILGLEQIFFECPYLSSEGQLEEFLISHKDFLAKVQSTLDDERKNFKNSLFHDAHFTQCTNKSLRTEYIQRIWNDPQHSNVRTLFHDPLNDYSPDTPSSSFKTFIEASYSEYRNLLRRGLIKSE